MTATSIKTTIAILFSALTLFTIGAQRPRPNGLIGSRRFISKQTIHQFLAPDAFHNGLGWMMDADNAFMKHAPAGSFGHTGFTGTSIAVVPQYRYVRDHSY